MKAMLALLLHYRYYILLPMAIAEGPIVAFIVGFLIFQGYLQIVPSAILLFLGDLLPDTAYYWIGYFSNTKESLRKFVRKIGLTEARRAFIDTMWHSHTKKALFLSKLAYGLSTPFLITAGISKYPYRKFIVGTMAVTVLQYGVLILTGYYFGSSYQAISGPLKNAGIIIALLALSVIFFSYRKFSKRVAQSLIADNE